eukprot:INCI14106.1.p1 GENE.INCI14106.1~~INCI14106.1.p1  ORF type:complete len:1091 (-),score=238.03 INCI14106.1:1586-4858(-)
MDSCAYDADNDLDSDNVCGNVDSCPADAENDADSDALCLHSDSCPHDAFQDEDSDFVCGNVDSCASDGHNDRDSDAICGDLDSCPADWQNDADSDLLCGNADSCQHDEENDVDSDSVCGDIDSCAVDFRNDADSDSVCGDVDSCADDPENDVDSDSFCVGVDSCPYDAENDADADNSCNSLDSCPYDEFNDADGDNICDDAGSFLKNVDDYLAAVDAASAQAKDDSDIDALQRLQDLMDAFCLRLMAGNFTGPNATSLGAEQLDNFAFSCSLPDPLDGGFSVESETGVGLVVTGATGDGTSVNIFVSEGGDDNATLLSNVVGITVSSGENATGVAALEDVDSGIQISISLGSDNSDNSTANDDTLGLRRRVSCRFYNRESGEWDSTGVFLRGIGVEAAPTTVDGITAAAICVTTHLTLFTVADSGKETSLVEGKVQLVSQRFRALSDVDLFDSNTEFDPLVTALFGSITAIFIVIVSVAKTTGRKDAIYEARLVFAQYGRLARPTVIGGDEFEAILRGWLPGCTVLGMVFLQILSVSPYLALFFRWTHENIVFTAADKAYVLYAALLSTFLVQAFFLETDQASKGFGDIMTNVFVGAAVANTILFPVQYLLPFMIANVNSFTTNTTVPRSLAQQQAKVMMKRLGCVSKRTLQLEEAQQANQTRQLRVLAVLQTWWDRTIDTRLQLQNQSDISRPSATWSVKLFSKASSLAKRVKVKAQAWEQLRHVPKILRFLNCRIPLPSRAEIRGQAAEQSDLEARAEALAAANAMQANSTATKVMERFQCGIRQQQLRRRRIRLIEFDSWERDCRRERTILLVINTTFLGILSLFTMMICILLSAAFNPEQCLQWVAAVAQSIAMQIVVTAPLVGVVVLTFKMVGAWVLVRANRAAKLKARKKQLRLRSAALAVRKAMLLRKLKTLSPKVSVSVRKRLDSDILETAAMEAAVQRAQIKTDESHLTGWSRSRTRSRSDSGGLAAILPLSKRLGAAFKRRVRPVRKVVFNDMDDMAVGSLDGVPIELSARAAEGSIATDVTFDKKERRALKLASMRRRARSRRLKKQCDSDSAVADDGTLGKTLAGFENVRQGICNVSY